MRRPVDTTLLLLQLGYARTRLVIPSQAAPAAGGVGTNAAARRLARRHCTGFDGAARCAGFMGDVCTACDGPQSWADGGALGPRKTPMVRESGICRRLTKGRNAGGAATVGSVDRDPYCVSGLPTMGDAAHHRIEKPGTRSHGSAERVSDHPGGSDLRRAPCPRDPLRSARSVCGPYGPTIDSVCRPSTIEKAPRERGFFRVGLNRGVDHAFSATTAPCDTARFSDSRCPGGVGAFSGPTFCGGKPARTSSGTPAVRGGRNR